MDESSSPLNEQKPEQEAGASELRRLPGSTAPRPTNEQAALVLFVVASILAMGYFARTSAQSVQTASTAPLEAVDVRPVGDGMIALVPQTPPPASAPQQPAPVFATEPAAQPCTACPPLLDAGFVSNDNPMGVPADWQAAGRAGGGSAQSPLAFQEQPGGASLEVLPAQKDCPVPSGAR